MSYLFGGTPFDGYARDGRRSLNGGGGGGIINTVLEVAAVVVAVVQPELAPLAFAAVGAIEGSEKGGDAVWKGATSGAVTGTVAAATGGLVSDLSPVAAGAVQGAIGGAAGGATQAGLSGGSVGEAAAIGGASGAVGGAVGGGVGGAIGGDVGKVAGSTLGGATRGAAGAALSGKDVEGAALRGAERGFLTSAGGVAGSRLGEAFQDRGYGYETADAAYDNQGNKIAEWNPETGQYETATGEALASNVPLMDYGQLGGAIGRELGSLAYQAITPTSGGNYGYTSTSQQTRTAGGGTGTTGGGGGGGGVDQVLFPQIGTGTGALAQALRSTPTGAIGGGGVEPSSGEGKQENVWNVASLKLKDALGA